MASKYRVSDMLSLSSMGTRIVPNTPRLKRQLLNIDNCSIVVKIRVQPLQRKWWLGLTFSSDTTYYRKARDGNAFVVSNIFTATAGDSVNIHIGNPDGSGKQYWIVSMKITSDGQYNSTIYDGFSSAPSSGSSVEINNILLDEDGVTTDDGTAVANKNVSFTATSEHAVGVGGGGSGGTSSGFETKHPPIVMEQNRDFVVEVENTGTDTNDYGITIIYYESTM